MYSDNFIIMLFAFFGFLLGGTVMFLANKISGNKKKRYMKPDKIAKVFDKKQADAVQQTGKEVMLKLDFPSIIKDMERYYTLNRGKKIANRIAVWINWLKKTVQHKGLS